MQPKSRFSADDLRRLECIDVNWMSADYWQDETIQRYHRFGLVCRDRQRIRLTNLGRRVCSILTRMASADARQPVSPSGGVVLGGR